MARNSCFRESLRNKSACLAGRREEIGLVTENAIQELRACGDEISRVVTRMHPMVPALNNAAAQAEIIRALFELTKQVEVVKKQLLKMQKEDDSKLV